MRPLSSPLLLACVLSGVLSAGCNAGARSASGSDGHPLIGSPAPEFALDAASGGGKVSLEDAAGKVALIDFWATWCVPCRASFPKYQALFDKYEGQVTVIAISEDEDPEDVPGFINETGVKFPVAWDAGKAAASAYKPESMPTLFILDANGLVRFVHLGFRSGDEADVEAKLKTLL
jgi:thiol-disulfide isomerase/thioredoxin